MSDSDFKAALAALQQAGAAQRDPIGFQHMVLMARRLPSLPDAVQRLLSARLREALARASEASAALNPNPSVGPSAAATSPLAALHRHIQAQSPTSPLSRSPSHPQAKAPLPELRSLDRFRGTWAKVAADAQVDKALARAPENAGPLNSHLLVLRSLAALRELSPEHLHAVLAQLDALLWLEQATQKPTASTARRAGGKK